MLRSGPRAVATAVRWREPDGEALATGQALAHLRSLSPSGVIAWINTSDDYSIREFEATATTLLDSHRNSSASVVIAPYIDPTFADGERLLNLTVIGA